MKRLDLPRKCSGRWKVHLLQGILVTGVVFYCGVLRADRCPNGVVMVGDSKFEVITKCGEPSFEDFRQVEKIAQTGANEVTRWIIDIEELVYDFGPNRFIRIFEFENGVLAGISQGGYGKSSDDDGQDYVRNNQRVQKGDSKYEVMMKLGYPVHKEKREVEKLRRTAIGESVVHRIFLEEWTFDPGPGRFIRLVVFENGRVIRIDLGDRSRAS